MTDEKNSKYMDRHLSEAQNKWTIRCNDFGSAYCIALNKFKDKLDEQEKRDKEKAEQRAALIMSALSLCGGSILMSVYGKSALKEVTAQVVKGKATAFAVHKGWDATKSAIAWTDQNATAKLIMGSLWDEAQSKVTAPLKEALAQVEQKATLPKGGHDGKTYAQVFQNNLVNLVLGWSIGVSQTARWVHEHLKGEASVQTLLNSSPFFHPPKTAINIPEKASRIELAFWMNYILGRDYMKTTTYNKRPGFRGFEKGVVERKTIDTNPWSRSYPRPHRTNTPEAATYHEVKFQEIGDVVIKRINELYQGVFGGPFFLPGTDFYGNVTHETVRCAHTAVLQLANSNAVDVKRSLLG
ncbi:hypothetical protein [Roseibium marinum]|uniref:Uncharacterized protein n=1 Tax=Roseibium marinum TaxID=281252 RepID=A0A2S3USD4_9HYPH|nr:hypothetical protein [Roseibium marinum]POF30480.1 hypothetical protein CLV41_10694 [Roseibium marinum]